LWQAFKGDKQLARVQQVAPLAGALQRRASREDELLSQSQVFFNQRFHTLRIPPFQGVDDLLVRGADIFKLSRQDSGHGDNGLTEEAVEKAVKHARDKPVPLELAHSAVECEVTLDRGCRIASTHGVVQLPDATSEIVDLQRGQATSNAANHSLFQQEAELNQFDNIL
jgi:hypothetical protein